MHTTYENNLFREPIHLNILDKYYGFIYVGIEFIYVVTHTNISKLIHETWIEVFLTIMSYDYNSIFNDFIADLLRFKSKLVSKGEFSRKKEIHAAFNLVY